MLRALALACLLSTALLAVPGAAADADGPAALCAEAMPDCDNPNPGSCRAAGYDCISPEDGWCDYFAGGVCINA